MCAAAEDADVDRFYFLYGQVEEGGELGGSLGAAGHGFACEGLGVGSPFPD